MKKKSSQRFIWVAALCGAALIGAGIFLRLRMQTTEVAPGRVSDRIVARAVVTAEGGIAEIRARTEGRVLSVHVREGDRVEAGQLLAEIESDSLEAELLRLEAERKAAALTARSVAEGARAEEKSALEAEVRGARADLDGAQDHLERLKKVREVGGGTAAEEKEAERAVAIALARLDAAQARLKLARAGGKASDIKALEARVAAADAAVVQAKTGLDKTRLISPISGTVLSRRVDAGDTITAAAIPTALFEIADTARTEIRIEVEENDARRVSPGLKVRLTTPGGSELIGEGEIARIGARLERRTIGVEDARVRADGQVRTVWMSGAGLLNLPIGQRLEAVIELLPREVPALAPRSAVHIRDGRAVVEVPWGPWKRQVPVKMGAADAANVELLGMEAGTRVVVGGGH